jgi:hypothetical protein
MTTRISEAKIKSINKTGIVPLMKENIQYMWNKCNGFTVTILDEGEQTYKVSRNDTVGKALATRHVINVKEQNCTCGWWQDLCTPCIDACAYFRLIENLEIDDITVNKVSPYYHWYYQQQLMNNNFKPVTIASLQRDMVTQPPTQSNKRQPGRPKNNALRKRRKYANAEDSPIVCSKCGMKGHNKRSCDAIQAFRQSNEKTRNQHSESENDVDLS